MTDQLTQYFEGFAENSIQRMKAAVLAISYYERIKLRLIKKEDLSAELAIIKKVGAAGTMEVVKEAIADYKSQLAGAWTLHPRLVELGKYKCSLIVNDREQLPRADVTYQFKSSAGTVKIHITSAGETFRLEISAGKNPMAAQLARTELEKNLTFIALTGS
jgi:hypothetical protein